MSIAGSISAAEPPSDYDGWMEWSSSSAWPAVGKRYGSDAQIRRSIKRTVTRTAPDRTLRERVPEPAV
jgi:hypothetical protein